MDMQLIFVLLIETHIHTTTSHFSVSLPGRVRTLPSRKRQTRPKDVEGKFSLCLELSAWCVWAPRAQQEEGQQRLQGVQDDAQHAATETQERWRVHLRGVQSHKPFRLIYTDQLSGDSSEQFILVISLQQHFCPSQDCGCSADLKEDRCIYMMLLKVNSLFGNPVPPELSQSQRRRMTHPQKTP